MDDDFGAAQPIADVVKGAYKKMNDLFGVLPSPPKAMMPEENKSSADPDKVKRANDSFRKLAEQQQIPTQTKAQKRPTVSAKVQVKTSVKPSVGGKPGGGK